MGPFSETVQVLWRMLGNHDPLIWGYKQKILVENEMHLILFECVIVLDGE